MVALATDGSIDSFTAAGLLLTMALHMLLSRATKIYIVAVAVGAIAGIIAAGSLAPGKSTLIGVLLFGTMAFLSENFAVRLPRAGTVSVSFTIVMAACVVFGPQSAALSALFNAIIYRDFHEKTSPYRWLFNGSQYSLSAAVAGIIYVRTGGLVLAVAGRPFAAADFPYQLVPIAVFAGVFFLVNSSLVSQVIALYQGVPFRSVWFENIQGTKYNYLAFTPLAVAMADIFARSSYVGLLLVVFPLAVARQTFRIYMNLKETYWGTVKSLIASLEAKDEYTSGHSERVAEFSEKIGRMMKLEEEDMTLLRYAATLHDIGKIGTAVSILKKPARLTEEEYQQMQMHPESGAMIIQEVEFLRDVVPIVFHHHERVDGGGYGDGLKGDEIPLLSRILAVADAYDAMTSPRPYRDALSPEVARAELLACSGTQFDAQVVTALLAVLTGDSGEDRGDLDAIKAEGGS